MKPEPFYKAGKITRVHGVKGQLSISLHEPELFKDYTFEVLFINPSGGPVPFFVSSFSFSLNKNILLVQLEGIEDKASASAFVQKEVFLQTSDLPEPDDNHFYAQEVVGYMVSDLVAGELGPVKEVMDLPMQQIFLIMKGSKEILIPAVEGILLKIDRNLKTILLKAPDGLLDIYLTPGSDEEEE